MRDAGPGDGTRWSEGLALRGFDSGAAADGLLDQLGLHLFGDTGVYRGSASDAIMPYAVAERVDIGRFVLNAVFLQSIVTEPYGSNGPLWTLSYEFRYYVLFPLTVFAFVAGPVRRGVSAALLAICVLWFIGRDLRINYLIWLMGAMLALLPVLPAGREAVTVLSAGMLAATLGATRVGRLEGRVSDFAVSFAVSVFLFSVIHSSAGSAKREGKAERPGAHPLGTRLARFSYTLYLVHLPALVFLGRAVTGPEVVRWQPDAMHLALAGGITITVVSYAMLIAYFTEDRTDQLRGRILAAGPFVSRVT